MKSFDTELKKIAYKVHMSAAERRDVRERLLSYMEYHPLPRERRVATHHKEQKEHIVSQPFVVVHFNTIYTRVAAGFFAVLLIIGVPFAAERSVPGDALYLVKTKINEGIAEQFANSPFEKVEFETRLLERRIAEARFLASEGKLTPEVEAQIAETVKGHADAAQAGIAELRVADADGAAIAEISFDSALEVQSAVLEGSQGEIPATSTDGILDAVKVAQAEVSENKGDTAPSFDGLMAQVEIETTRAIELLASIEPVLTDDEQTDIKRRLDDIERKVESARRDTPEEAVESVEKLVHALSLTQKLIAFMTDIDVRQHVALESLVPVEPTVEERVATAQKLLTEIIALAQAVTERIPYLTEPSLIEKATLGQVELKTYIASATTSLAAGNIVGTEAVLPEAYALAVDLDALTAGVLVSESETEGETETSDVIPGEGEVLELEIPSEVSETPASPTETTE